MVSAPDPPAAALGLAALAYRLELPEDQQLLGAEAERRILWRMRAVASLPTVANGAPSVLEARASHRLRMAVRTVALPLDVPAGWY
jgi:hypothetical protein